MDVIFWGGLVRFGEALLAGAPTLLVGLFVAGVFRKLIGPSTTLKLFGGRTWRSLPQSWLWGMLLPVCSIGVIPVAYELRRAGLKGGAILAFALTAPLFNPLSLLYGLTLSTPITILTFAFGSLLVVTSVGLIWDWLFPSTEIVQAEELEIAPGLERLATTGLVAARHMAGPTAIYAIIGLAGSILLAAIFPFGSLTDTMSYKDLWAPVKMLIIALPAYATPLNVMMQVGGMFVHGNSVGAAYVLLSIGTGVNLGLIVWAWKTYGMKRALVFLAAFIAVVIAIAYAVNDTLYTAGDVEHPHTHAFDVYACPFSSSVNGLAEKSWSKLVDEAQLYEVVGLVSITILFGIGIILETRDPLQKTEEHLARLANSKKVAEPTWMNVVVPGSVLGVTAIVGLIAISVVGCYVYYPSPEQTIEDLKYVKAEVLSTANSREYEKCVKNIAIYDDLARKLEVGYYLRNWQLSEFQQAKAKLLRGRLEQLKDILEADQFDRVREARTAVSNAHRRVVEAFEDP